MLLENKKIVQWCYEPLTVLSLKNTSNEDMLNDSAGIERAWGNKTLNKIDLKQWTTTLGQNIACEVLQKCGRKNVKKTKARVGVFKGKKYSPDLECDEFVYEVKTRSWTTPGTAGEKILGVPMKYGEVPNVYHKPLKIILVAYQEYEARHGWAFGNMLDPNNQTKELRESLEYFKRHNIEYVGLTDLLKEIGLPYGCWNK